MQFIKGANRHQILSGTLDALEAADNPAQLVDVFVAAGNAKKLTPPASCFSTGF
jgi:hypothetical protein